MKKGDIEQILIEEYDNKKPKVGYIDWEDLPIVEKIYILIGQIVAGGKVWGMFDVKKREICVLKGMPEDIEKAVIKHEIQHALGLKEYEIPFDWTLNKRHKALSLFLTVLLFPISLLNDVVRAIYYKVHPESLKAEWVVGD